MDDINGLLNEHISAINTVWVALCAALIFFMEAGFALLEADTSLKYFKYFIGIFAAMQVPLYV